MPPASGRARHGGLVSMSKPDSTHVLEVGGSPMSVSRPRVLVALGAAFLGLSFYARRWFGARRWRTIHRATIGVWALAVIHTLGSGTDATQLWMRVILVFTGVPIIYLFILRLMPGEAKPARRARPAASSAGAER